MFVFGQRLDSVRLAVPFTLESLGPLAFKRLAASASIFLLASKEEVKNFCDHLAANFHGVLPHVKGKTFHARDCIDAGHRGRLGAHEQKAQSWRRMVTQAACLQLDQDAFNGQDEASECAPSCGSEGLGMYSIFGSGGLRMCSIHLLGLEASTV